MATSKIKVGDTVRVIAGVDKDKEGKVIEVKDGKVKVEGVNMVKKHVKPNQANAKGGIVEEEAAFDISNVMYVVDGKLQESVSKLRMVKTKSAMQKQLAQ